MTDVSTGQVSRSAAEVYDELFVPALFQQFTGRVLAAAHVGPGDAVLDVGCGTGVLAGAAADLTGSAGPVCGLDVNADMLAVASRRRSGIDWRQGDARQLPFENGRFDAVVSQFTLMFVPDPVDALREMKRVCRVGGRVAVAVWGELDEAPGYAALARLLSTTLGEEAAASVAGPFALGDPAALRRLLVDAGLEGTVERHVGVVRFDSLETWVRTEIRGWTLAGTTDDATLEQLVDVARRDLVRFVEPDGQVAFPVTALIAQADRPALL